jgi:SAM-dependent methyltransferase
VTGRKSVVFDRIAEQYDETRGGMERGRDFANVIAPLLPSDVDVLELGVGTGIIAAALGERGHHVVGFDLSQPMLERAHARLGARVGRADVHDLPVASASVDAVVTVWVLHLVGDAATVVGEIGRVLRPGGTWVNAIAGNDFEPIAGDDLTAIDQAMRTATSDASGRTRDGRTPLLEWAEPVGLALAHETRTSPWEHFQSPAEIIAAAEARTYSSTWNLDDEQWRTVVEPHLAALRALPDPERPRRRVASNSVLAFRRR